MLPTGTVSFLFTDVEGSTTRWESHREAMQAAMRRHDAIFTEVAGRLGGTIFKTIGDAFCIAFATAPAAIGAALEISRAVAAEDWSAVDGLRVRMAVHTGDADERDGDFFGPVVNRVARLLVTGHGGQILVSGVAADLAQGALPPQTALRDLGSHRLKDLAYPEQVYQLTGSGLEASFPPLRTLDALPNNLPLQLTAFLGREEEVAEIRALVERSRLVTLVGSGGVGKTRTSLQVAAEVLDRFPDGVWFIELAPLKDPSVIEAVVLSVMGLSGGPTPTASTVLDVLKGKRTLLVFDNCEHLVREAATVIDRILRACAHVSIIASSREGLGIGGEVVFRMPSLAVPKAGTTPTAEEAASYGAVALFVDRAQAFDREFVLTDENAQVVAEICRQLDGIALAIELAAPRIKVLSPKALLERLTERFRLLTGGSRAALPRQQTMRALIDWSYDLLSEAEQRVFRRVSVFAGGWTLEGATAVCTDEEVEEWDLLDLLSALVDKSLIVTERSFDDQRYRMLESTRQYARERLAQSGEQQRFLRRHAEHMTEFVTALDNRRWKVPQLEVHLRGQAERDNVRAALTWALTERYDPALAIRLVARAPDVFSQNPTELSRWLALAQPFADASIAAEDLARLALANGQMGDTAPTTEVLESALVAIDAYRVAGDAEKLTLALNSAARSLAFLGRLDEGRIYAHEAEALVGGPEAILLRAAVLMSRSLNERDPAERIRILEEAKRIYEVRGDDMRLLTVLMWLAEDEFAEGLTSRALSRARDAIARQRELNPRSASLAMMLNNCAAYALALDDLATAVPAAEEALRLGRDHGAQNATAIAFLHLAGCMVRTGRHESAARVLGYADTRMHATGRAIELTETRTFDEIRAALIGGLGDARYEEIFRAGASLTEDLAAAEALAH
jgi:predicted ATPase/class 3 adenylate cyclase